MDKPVFKGKIVIVNRSDSRGGAAVVSYRLMRALRGIGVDARMIVAERTVDDDNVALAGNALLRKTAFLAERLKIFVNNGFDRENLFKVDIANVGVGIDRHTWIKEADIVCLNWINQGFVSLKDIERLARQGKKIVWTMHDMWNMVGACHHAGECREYLADCGKCPFTRLAVSTFHCKKRLYSNADISFVAVSRWLAERGKESALLRDADIRVIPNAFPVSDYDFCRTSVAIDCSTIIFGAARLDDPIKGLDCAIDSFNILADRKVNARALLFGDIHNPQLLDRIRLPYEYVGRVPLGEVEALYRRADIVLSTSLYETLPGTVVEGMASGCVPVTFDSGGQTDIFDHGITGFIADYLNAESVADRIEDAIKCGISRQLLHEEVERRFAAEKVAQRYADLFAEKMLK